MIGTRGYSLHPLQKHQFVNDARLLRASDDWYSVRLPPQQTPTSFGKNAHGADSGYTLRPQLRRENPKARRPPLSAVAWNSPPGLGQAMASRREGLGGM